MPWSTLLLNRIVNHWLERIFRLLRIRPPLLHRHNDQLVARRDPKVRAGRAAPAVLIFVIVRTLFTGLIWIDWFAQLFDILNQSAPIDDLDRRLLTLRAESNLWRRRRAAQNSVESFAHLRRSLAKYEIGGEVRCD